MSENPLFPTGQVLCTPSAWREIKRYKVDISTLLKRHVLGDWDNMNGEDNSFSIEKGYLVSSSYVIATDTFNDCVFNTKVWIITEEDRSSTMILLPEEYDSLYAGEHAKPREAIKPILSLIFDMTGNKSFAY